MIDRVIVVGSSAGGMWALTRVVGPLPMDYPYPVCVVQHLHKSDRGRFALSLRTRVALIVVEPSDKCRLESGHLYVAPANYHLLIEPDETLALSVDERVNWSRPSVDVLFQSAARARGSRVVGIVLTGANNDGAAGLAAIQAVGGTCLVQDPESSDYAIMPTAAIAATPAALVGNPETIADHLLDLARTGVAR